MSQEKIRRSEEEKRRGEAFSSFDNKRSTLCTYYRHFKIECKYFANASTQANEKMYALTK